MLHWISVSNFQSLRDEITLDFRVPGTTPEKAWLRRPTSDPTLRVPTVIVLIGPNGSGKTTWLRALANTIFFAANSYGNASDQIFDFPAFATSESFDKPTRIEIEFDAPWCDSEPSEPNRVLRYTLELLRGTPDIYPDAVGYEALRDFPRGRPRRLMERRPGRPVHVVKDFSVKPSDDHLASIPANSSVLSTLSRMGIGKFEAIVESLIQIKTNVSTIETFRPDIETAARYFRDRPQIKDRISDRLGRLDLGIESMDVERTEEGKLFLTFTHPGLSTSLPLVCESAGTRHVVLAFPLLDSALETGSLAIMDSFDNDLHADIVEEMLSWFREEGTNSGNAQLICSLNGLSALDDLEKEEVFIVEKDRTGATQAYGARDVQGVRRSSDLRKLYRAGALGGLPSFG